MGTRTLDMYTMKMKNKEVYDRVFDIRYWESYGVLFPSPENHEIKVVEKLLDLEEFKDVILNYITPNNCHYYKECVDFIKEEAGNYEEVLIETFTEDEIIKIFTTDLANVPIPFNLVYYLLFDKDFYYVEPNSKTIEVNGSYVWVGVRTSDNEY